MNQDNLTSQLVENLKQPFFQCQIAVRDLFTYYNTIVECLRQKGYEGEKVVSEVRMSYISWKENDQLNNRVKSRAN